MRLCVGLKCLRAVTTLKQKRFTVSDLRHFLLEFFNLWGKNYRRYRFENLPHILSLMTVPARLLLCVTRQRVLELCIEVSRERWQIGENFFGDIYCPTHT